MKKKAICACVCVRRPKPGAQFVFVSAFRFGGGLWRWYRRLRRHPLPGTRLVRIFRITKTRARIVFEGLARERKIAFCVECVYYLTRYCTLRNQLGANISPPKRELLLLRRHFCSPRLCLLCPHLGHCSVISPLTPRSFTE